MSKAPPSYDADLEAELPEYKPVHPPPRSHTRKTRFTFRTLNVANMTQTRRTTINSPTTYYTVRPATRVSYYSSSTRQRPHTKAQDWAMFFCYVAAALSGFGLVVCLCYLASTKP
jgi:hypothetical protein